MDFLLPSEVHVFVFPFCFRLFRQCVMERGLLGAGLRTLKFCARSIFCTKPNCKNDLQLDSSYQDFFFMPSARHDLICRCASSVGAGCTHHRAHLVLSPVCSSGSGTRSIMISLECSLIDMRSLSAYTLY